MGNFDFQQTGPVLQEIINSVGGKAEQTEVNELRALYDALTQSNIVPVPSADWPVSNPQVNVIYRVAGTSSYTDYMWDGTDFIPMATYDNVPTDIPTVGSTDVITAGGVANHGSAFDISEYNKNGATLATYADLSAALAAVPSSVQKGGMSIKFVRSSDNKYVQYRLMKNQWSINTDDWSFCGDDVYVSNQKYVKVELDADDKIIKAMFPDGTIDNYTKNEFKSGIGASSVDIDDVVTESSGDSGRYIIAELDADDRIHHAVEKSGVHRFPAGIDSPTIDALNTKIEEATPNDYDDVKERLNEVVPATRSFFSEEITTSAATIREHSTEPCLVLSIITDTHERPYSTPEVSNAASVRQTDDTFANVAAVGRKCVVDGVVHLGDWLFAGYSYPTQDVVNDYLEKYRRLVAKCNDKVYFLFGNHDGVGAANPSIGSAYAELFKMNEDYVKREGANPYYCFDDEKIKVRCICFDDNIYPALYGWNKEQIQWFADVLSELEDGWQIIIISHIQPYGEGGLTNKNDVVGIANAFNNHTSYTCTSYSDISVDFTGNENTKTVAWISGHAHYDMVITDNSVFEEYDLCCPIILIGCSLLYQAPSVPEGAVSYSRTDKTVTQDLWDTMVYRPDLGKIYMVRFGAGVDREINV